MLRALVALLLIANLAFFGWSQGWLDGVVGVAAHGDREPERLAHQLRPDSIVLLPGAAHGAAAGTAGMAVTAGASCLEAGPFNAAEAAAAESTLRGVAPSAVWTDIPAAQPGTWLVYMGSYPDRATLLRKEQEIGRVRGADFEEIAVPGEGEFGLSLGRFDDRATAERALAQHMRRGIRTARVLQLDTPSVMHLLRVEHADAALAAQLTAADVGVPGKGFMACARNEAAR